MIYECLKDNTSQLAELLELKLPQTISIDECIAYLNGLGYFDLKNASNLKSIAKKILIKENNPFEKITNRSKNYIDDFYSLKNYVAHRSNKSKKTLISTYQKYDQNGFIEVGQFLLEKSNKNKNKTTIRFWWFILVSSI